MSTDREFQSAILQMRNGSYVAPITGPVPQAEVARWEHVGLGNLAGKLVPSY